MLDLDAITGLDLPPLPTHLYGAVISLPLRTLCPWCAVRPAGLLEGHCGAPDCRTAYLDTDRRHVRADDN